GAAHIDEHAVHVKDQDLRPYRFFHPVPRCNWSCEFPVGADAMHAAAREKIQNQDSTWAVGARIRVEQLERAPAICGESKKKHPAFERKFCSSVERGAAGVKISKSDLGKILRTV